MKDPLKNVLPHIRGIQAYTPGTQPSDGEWIKLNTNELPYAPPKSVGEAVKAEFGRLAYYPNPRSSLLREAIAEKFGLNFNQVIIGNGSDDILNLLTRAFGGNKNAVGQTVPSYSLYPVLTAIADGELHSVEFDESFALPVDRLIALNPQILFLTCPNAPTGVRFPFEDLEKLSFGLEGLLVVDEAYAEFAEGNALDLLKRHRNVVITRTFSKAYGLAGLRVGYAMGDPEIIDVLDRIRDSYNVNRLSQAGALAALNADTFYSEVIAKVKATREQFRSFLRQKGWHVYPSESNFIFAKPNVSSEKTEAELARSLFNYLEGRRIIVRSFPNHRLTAAYLRISIGTDDQMNRLSQAIEQWEQNA